MITEISINQWTNNHANWLLLCDIIEHLGQTAWVEFHAEWHLQSIMLVAYHENMPLGFLRFVIQHIGTEDDLPAIQYKNNRLSEAKVIAFGVVPEYRRQGIGKALQLAMIDRSRRENCYQIRSHSSLSYTQNHDLKLSLGFGVHPLPSSPKRDGYYFVLPLYQSNAVRNTT